MFIANYEGKLIDNEGKQNFSSDLIEKYNKIVGKNIEAEDGLVDIIFEPNFSFVATVRLDDEDANDFLAMYDLEDDDYDFMFDDFKSSLVHDDILELLDKKGIVDFADLDINFVSWLEKSNNNEEKTSESFEKAGGPFWYFTKHGVQPGSVPKDINILDVLDAKDGTGSYFLSDKVIDTKQLNEYELKELGPDTEYNTEEYYSDDDFNFENELPGYSNDLTICPNCGARTFNDKLGLCIDCGYDEKSYGDL